MDSNSVSCTCRTGDEAVDEACGHAPSCKHWSPEPDTLSRSEQAKAVGSVLWSWWRS